MNIEAYNLIIETISKILEAKEFKAVDLSDGSYFTNGTVAVKVCYDDARELFTLEHSVMEEEAPSTDWKILSSWLFAADAPVKEAKSIANDFEDSLREFLGVKPATAKTSTAASALPSKGNNSDEPTPSVLAGRFLTVFPQFKDEYNKYVTETGTFLYVLFFEEIAAPHFGDLLDADDKKRLEKFFDMMNFVYCNGNKEVRAVVSTCIMANALRNNPARMETAMKYLENFPFLKITAEHSAKVKVK